MPIALKNVYVDQPGNTDTTLYTVPANTSARILKCTVTNDTTTVVTISFNKRPGGEAVTVTIFNSLPRLRISSDTYLSLTNKSLGDTLALTGINKSR